jgi:hypothetical protein
LTWSRSPRAAATKIQGLKWSEVDLDAKLVTIPAAPMTRSIEFKAPLSDQALVLLKPLDERREAASNWSSPARAPASRS